MLKVVLTSLFVFIISDSEYNEQQKQFYTFLHDYRGEKSELNRQNMVKSRSAYKQLIRKKRY